jgi:hypothetical protein
MRLYSRCVIRPRRYAGMMQGNGIRMMALPNPACGEVP